MALPIRFWQLSCALSSRWSTAALGGSFDP